jgi:hypothetical protein
MTIERVDLMAISDCPRGWCHRSSERCPGSQEIWGGLPSQIGIPGSAHSKCKPAAWEAMDEGRSSISGYSRSGG